MNQPPRQRGFTLVEVMVTLAILVGVLAATWMVVSAVISQDDALKDRVELQLQCSNGLSSMISLLKQSGVTQWTGAASAQVNNWPTQAVSNSTADGIFPNVFTLGTTTGTGVIFPGTIFGPCSTWAPPGSDYMLTHVMHTCVQMPNVSAYEGLGVSQGVLFRVAEDSDYNVAGLDPTRQAPPNGAGSQTVNPLAVSRGMPITKATAPKTITTTTTVNGVPVTTTTTVNVESNEGSGNNSGYFIEWGNYIHAISVVYNKNTGYNELVHFTWDTAGNSVGMTVLANYVSRLILEVNGLPAAPQPLWPLPNPRAKNQGESTVNYQSALGQTYPLPPASPYQMRITLCLSKPSVNNPSNSLLNKNRPVTVWQQANVYYRSLDVTVQ